MRLQIDYLSTSNPGTSSFVFVSCVCQRGKSSSEREADGCFTLTVGASPGVGEGQEEVVNVARVDEMINICKISVGNQKGGEDLDIHLYVVG